MFRLPKFATIFILFIFMALQAEIGLTVVFPNYLFNSNSDSDAQKTSQKTERLLSPFEKDIVDSTGLLYGYTGDGSLRMFCTATLFSDDSIDSNKFYIVSAAHCVAEDNTDKEISVAVGVDWFFTFDDNKPENAKVFFPAKIIGIGYQNRGDDFSLFEINPQPAMLDRPIVKIPLGNNPSLMEPVINVASPMGLGKQVFRGYVSSENLNRPLVVKDYSINWRGAVLIQVAADPGSSGSAIVSGFQKGIVSLLVGGIGNTVVTIPVERFKKFLKEIGENKYEWFDPKKSLSADQSKTTMQQKWNKLQERR